LAYIEFLEFSFDILSIYFFSRLVDWIRLLPQYAHKRFKSEVVEKNKKDISL